MGWGDHASSQLGAPAAHPSAGPRAAPSRHGAGPIPFLPDNDILVQRLEKQWGELGKYQGIRCANKGAALRQRASVRCVTQPTNSLKRQV